MKKNDLLMGGLLLILVMLFLPFPFLESFQKGFLFNSDFWAITSFLKFAILATFGELIGLRINTGNYTKPGFGILPRAIVWGLLGIGIKMAFVIFASGSPILLDKLFNMGGAVESMKFASILDAAENGMGWTRFFAAFTISTMMNLIFAPVFMTLHKITDTHILQTGGTVKGFFSWIPYKKIFPELNWFVQWDFVFKRTIPFFWIPAHTVTFMMPSEYRIVFAALLGVVLGVLLAIAAQKK